MGLITKKGLTAEETAAIVSSTAIAKGVDVAKTAIVGILGRGKPFTKVHVGCTDIDLGKKPVERDGFTVTAIHAGVGPQVMSPVMKTIGDWLHACHGKRYEAVPAKTVVEPGTKILYLAVAY